MYSEKVARILRRKKIEVGDKIEVKKGKRLFSGILMPRIELGDRDALVLKLDNGYNIGIKFAKGLRIKKVSGKTRLEKIRKKKITFDKSKPTIAILHTGGTIASRLDYRTGGVVASFKPEDIVEMFPELEDVANIHSVFVGNLQSENMRFSHYNKIARAIQKEVKKGVSGVIVTHGTDTLAYTSAALAFMLEDFLPIPVVLVGAQRSSDRGSSDAGMNLICAAKFIASTDFAGVAICMHETEADINCLILPATKTRKMHTSRRDAFRPINAKPIAKVNYQSGGVEFLDDYLKRGKSKLKLRLFKENVKVALLKIHTNFSHRQLDFYRKAGYDGLVVEGTGLGHMPTMGDKENERILETVKKLTKNCVVVLTSQTIYGRVNMNVYSPQRDLLNAGVLGNFADMLPETAFVKLAWLLSNYPKEKTRELIGENLRGEISERSEEETYLW